MKISIDRISSVAAAAAHNAFTGLCRFQGRYYLAFRSAASHMATDGVITVLVSDDGNAWRAWTVLSAGRERDLRDPKLIVFQDRLLLFAAIRDRNRTGRESRCYQLQPDGEGNQLPLTGIPARYWLWGVANDRNHRLYGSAYLQTGTTFQCRLLYSSDGCRWQEIGPLPWTAGETALDCADDGSVYGLSRLDIPPFQPEYFHWQPPAARPASHRRLPVVLHGPCLRRYPHGSLLIGREWPVDQAEAGPRRVAMHFLHDDGRLESLGALPSGGDCSYAAVCPLNDSQALVSYYSSHESGRTGVYVARLSIDWQAGSTVRPD